MREIQNLSQDKDFILRESGLWERSQSLKARAKYQVQNATEDSLRLQNVMIRTSSRENPQITKVYRINSSSVSQ